jgi:hypothetical protein
LLQLLAVSLNKIDENLITEHISEMFDNWLLDANLKTHYLLKQLINDVHQLMQNFSIS